MFVNHLGALSQKIELWPLVVSANGTNRLFLCVLPEFA